MESDPDLMDDANELQMFCYLLVLIVSSRLVFVCLASAIVLILKTKGHALVNYYMCFELDHALGNCYVLGSCTC